MNEVNRYTRLHFVSGSSTRWPAAVIHYSSTAQSISAPRYYVNSVEQYYGYVHEVNCIRDPSALIDGHTQLKSVIQICNNSQDVFMIISYRALGLA